MFIEIQAELNTREVMKQILKSHSAHYVLYLLADEVGHCTPENFADHITGILESGIE